MKPHTVVEMKGGKREGAGRPPLDDNKKKRAISVFLSPDVLALLDSLPESRGVLIERAVREQYGVIPEN